MVIPDCCSKDNPLLGVFGFSCCSWKMWLQADAGTAFCCRQAWGNCAASRRTRNGHCRMFPGKGTLQGNRTHAVARRYLPLGHSVIFGSHANFFENIFACADKWKYRDAVVCRGEKSCEKASHSCSPVGLSEGCSGKFSGHDCRKAILLEAAVEKRNVLSIPSDSFTSGLCSPNCCPKRMVRPTGEKYAVKIAHKAHTQHAASKSRGCSARGTCDGLVFGQILASRL